MLSNSIPQFVLPSITARVPQRQPASLRTTNTLALCEQVLAERDAPAVRLLAIFSHLRRVALARLERKAQRIEPIPPQATSAPTLIIRPLWIIWPARKPTPSLLDGLPAFAIVPAPLAELPLKPVQPRIVVPNSPSQQAIASNRYNEARKLASMLISFGIATAPDVHTAQWIAPDNVWRYDLHPLTNGIIVKRRKPNHHQWIVAEQCVTSKGEYEAIRADLERKYGIELEIYNKRLGHVATPADKIVVTRGNQPAKVDRDAMDDQIHAIFDQGRERVADILTRPYTPGANHADRTAAR